MCVFSAPLCCPPGGVVTRGVIAAQPRLPPVSVQPVARAGLHIVRGCLERRERACRGPASWLVGVRWIRQPTERLLDKWFRGQRARRRGGFRRGVHLVPCIHSRQVSGASEKTNGEIASHTSRTGCPHRATA